MDQQGTGDLLGRPQNHLWALFADNKARSDVRRLVFNAFGKHFVSDPTQMQLFKIRMSDRAPSSDTEEQALDKKARGFHSKALPITEFGEGTQAFVGLISALLSLPQKIMLIDEPDAFLHPPLARRLGMNLVQLSQERDASLVVATHSSEFLMGCLESDATTSIVRLTFENGIATARALEPSYLAQLMKDPLLRSTGPLRALFHRGAVVTEADTDRAFYDEINYRLLEVGRGIREDIFLNA